MSEKKKIGAKRTQGHSSKAQTALEFLTTYGWAILAIIAVLAVLYQLGVFDIRTFTVRALPGQCSVQRFTGAGKISSVSLQGVCTGLPPKYVAHFGYLGPFSETGTSNITINSITMMPAIDGVNKQQITMTAWVYSNFPGNTETPFYYGVPPPDTSGQYNAIYMNYNQTGMCNGGVSVIGFAQVLCIYKAQIPRSKWLLMAAEYNGQTATGYVVIGGNLITGSKAYGVVIPAGSTLLISSPWNGSISNLQMYNTTLSQDNIMALYKEGIGGAPIDLPALVGWWPLNGDWKDYSGNNQNGYPTNSNAGVWATDYSPS